MRQKSQKLCKCMIKKMQEVLSSIALLALSGAALATPAIPPDLNGCKILWLADSLLRMRVITVS